MSQLQQWVWSNQWIVPIILWVLVTIITEIFKPRTPEQYAKMPPRLAAFLVMLGSVTNASKLIEYAKRIFTGWAQPPSAMLGLFVCAALLQGCNSARAADFGVTDRSLGHAKEIGKCLQDARTTLATGDEAKRASVCETFNACQRAVAVKYGVPPEGRCVETTPEQAADAGVPLSVLPLLGGRDVAAR